MLTIDRQDHQGAFAEKVVTRGPDPPETHHGVSRSEDGSENGISTFLYSHIYGNLPIQPTSSLRDEFRYCRWNVRSSFGTLDILQSPLCVSLAHDFCNHTAKHQSY